MNSYELSRSFFDWSYENPELVTPNHIAIYFFAIEHCNRLGWKSKFGFPTSMVKDAIGIKSYKTYIKAFNDLVEWGFIKLIEESKNQYSSNIIALVNFTKANTKALDKALSKHLTKHLQSTGESISSIDKQVTSNKEQVTIPPNPLKGEYENFILKFNEITKKKFRGRGKPESQFNARLKDGFTLDDILRAVVNCASDEYHVKNPHYLTPEFITKADKLEKYLNWQPPKKEPEKEKSYIDKVIDGEIPAPELDEKIKNLYK